MHIAGVAAVPAQRKNQARRGRRTNTTRGAGARDDDKFRRCAGSREAIGTRDVLESGTTRAGTGEERVVRGMWTKRHVDARETVEIGRDLVCVAVRCTGGEHIVMRAVSRVRYGRVTVASDREKAERKIFILDLL